MDIATMVAINNLNMMTMMQAMQQRQNVITILSNGKEERIMEADFQWIKVDAGKKGIQLINRNMVRNISFDNK